MFVLVSSSEEAVPVTGSHRLFSMKIGCTSKLPSVSIHPHHISNQLEDLRLQITLL